VKIMAVFAHPDDEIGCAATLAKHAARGDEITLVWTTYGENASHFEGVEHAEVKRVREGHGREVAAMLGARHHFFDLGDTRLEGSRREAIELARLYTDLQPDAVITWDDFNPHPDHRATAKIAYDAITLARIPKVMREGEGHEGRAAHRKPVSFYQYAAPESGRPVVHIEVNDTAELGARVLEYYGKFYGWEFTPEQFLGGRAALGRAVGVKYAEKFTLRRAHHPALEYLV
jgi:LmbE family N-acetylglucosaminyl deacetylase